MSSHSMVVTMAAVLVALVACGLGCMPPGEEPETPPVPGVPADEPKVEAPPSVPDADLKALAEGNNAFAIELYKKLAAESDGNIVVSPYSIRTALAMTYAGARGETAEEMAKVLGFGDLGERVHDAQHVLARKLSRNLNVGRQEYRSQNSLWLNNRTHFKGDFLRIAKSSYDAQATGVDFDSSPESAVGAINQWVVKETNGRIRHLLESRDVPEGTQLILANATFLKGLWQYPFDSTKTADATFHTSPNRTVKVKMMQHKIATSFWEGDGLKVAFIPYQNNSASMMLIVPDRVDGLVALESKLTSNMVDTWYTKQAEVLLSLRFPRLTVDNKRDLVPSLKAMGMAQAFNEKADFSGITSQGIGLSKVIHEATIEVNEEGAEAAAATAVVGVVPIGPQVIPKSRELNVDRPFCFAIYDHTTRSILFLGRVVTSGS